MRELHRRWFEKHPKGKPAQAPDAPSDWIPGSVFISYANEDRASAFCLADELTKAGLEVWVDRRLTAGDDFNARIRYHIRECSAFVAVLSRTTDEESGPGRYFRSEWDEACELSKRFTGTDRRFLFPVVVDGSPMGSLRPIQKEIFGRTATSAPGGDPPPDLVHELDTAQKAFRKGSLRS